MRRVGSRLKWLVVRGARAALDRVQAAREPATARSSRATRRCRPGKAEEALAHYDKAVAKLPGDPGVHFDRGAALYALSRFDEAGKEFLRATEARTTALKASAFYNLGNALFKKDKYKDAVAAYRRSLALRPDDKAAKWNLEIALHKQKEEEEKKKKDEDKKDDKDKDKDKKKDDKDEKDKDKKDDKDEKDKDKKDDKDKKQQDEEQERQAG